MESDDTRAMRPDRGDSGAARKAMKRGVMMALLVASGLRLAGAGELQAVGDEEAFFTDIPIVMSATRLPQPLLTSPVSTTVITREMIEASGFNEIADVFRLVPGFQVAHATGGHFVVAYHGQEFTLASRLEVLVDGRSVYGNILSSVQWNTLGVELEDIERIEIVRGPNAPVFGANAMVATINIITRQPYAEHGTWLDVTAGSLQTRELLFRHAGAIGEMDYRFGIGWERDEGFEMDPDHGADFDDSRLTNLSWRAVWSPTARDDLDIQLGLVTGQNATLNPETAVFELAHDGHVNAHYQFFRWTHNRGEDNSFFIQFYHNYEKQHDRSDFGPLSAYADIPSLLIPLYIDGRPDQTVQVYYADGLSERYDLEFQIRKRLSPVFRFVWGGGMRLDRLRSEAHLNRRDFLDNPSARLFANGEWAVGEALSLHLGGIVEHNDLIGPFGSARVAANYRFAPGHAVRASVGATQRSPSIIEQHWDAVVRFDDGSPLNQIFYSPGDLEPEKLVAVELGYAFIPANGALQFDAKLFHEKATDLISNYQDVDFPEPYFPDGAQINMNDDSYRISGIEGAIRWRPGKRDFLSFQYSLTRSRRNLSRGGSGDPVRIEHDATPEQTYSLLYNHDFEADLSASLGYYYRSGIKWIGDGDRLDGYDRVDLRLAKRFRSDRSEGRLELVVQNLGDDYQEYISKKSGRTTFETRYFIKAGIEF